MSRKEDEKPNAAQMFGELRLGATCGIGLPGAVLQTEKESGGREGQAAASRGDSFKVSRGSGAGPSSRGSRSEGPREWAGEALPRGESGAKMGCRLAAPRDSHALSSSQWQSHRPHLGPLPLQAAALLPLVLGSEPATRRRSLCGACFRAAARGDPSRRDSLSG